MDFSQLPEEMFIQILTYLDVRDLLSCSLVSKYWRQTVNNNSIWRQACHKNADTFSRIPCLDSREERFYESINNSQIYRSGELQPLCKWRINYMRYFKLVRNIQEGKYMSYEIKRPSTCSNIKFCDAFIAFAINSENCIEVWNIQNIPFRQDCIKFSLKNVNINIYEISSEYLVIVQCNLLEIYKNNGTNFMLVYRRLFNLPQICSKEIPDLDDISEWYQKNKKLSPNIRSIRYIVNGEFFVGLLSECDFNSPLIHIWDIKTGEKVNEIVIPALQKNIVDITFYSVNCCIFIKVVFHNGAAQCTRILGYSLKKQEFTNFDIELPCRVRDIVFKNTIVVVLEFSCFSVWDIETGKKLVNTQLEMPVLQKTFDVFNRYFAFVFLGRDVINVMKFSENNLKTICSFPVSYEGITHLSFLHNNFLMVNVFNSSYFTVWDIKNSRSLYKIENVGFTLDVAKSRCNTKVFFFLGNTIKILDFWQQYVYVKL